MRMKIFSPTFENESEIPCKYTCHGLDVNPELRFLSVPKEAKSLVLILEDPDVPRKFAKGDSWVHWLVWNIDPSTRKVRENEKFLGAVEGVNTSGSIGYEGPCPPNRMRKYHFHLYALDTKLNLPSKSSKRDVVEAMQGHIVDRAELVGIYKHLIREPI